jgi:UrcA family protein
MKESNRLRKSLLATAIAVLAIPAMVTAMPHVNEEGRTEIRVSYADLNLSSKAGLLTLYSRLQSASIAVCGPQNLYEAGSLEQLMNNRQCYQNALSKAVAKFNNEALNEIHAG